MATRFRDLPEEEQERVRKHQEAEKKARDLYYLTLPDSYYWMAKTLGKKTLGSSNPGKQE